MRFRIVFLVLFLFTTTACHHLVVLQPSGGTNSPRGAVSVRTDMWDRLNDERATRGLKPLKWDGALSDRSAAWSKTMAQTGFRHSNIGQLLGPYNYVGENIGVAPPGKTAGSLHVGFMASQAHRDDILAPGFTSAGIGVFCKDGTTWVTVEFGRRTTEGPGPQYAGGTSKEPVARTDPGSARC